ncbi:MAG: DNA polymerase III subunit gamma/tau [Planctomycetes bacterium]|nr:DNA polymerase III subunit gamma/tau [Planctomycetota bacterium]MCP4770279.1 DNA polymerase III subunit gamma/tau [Planctomycetota bacterium]MCP4861453.1 DNA polymerase III subunit gamma/tau [Planctomycetota bacterium]
MSEPAPTYRVFARKYRPRTFSEVIGQEHIVHALSRAIERQRVGQAYLLIGPRGVGKTTTARIIAKSMNCEQGPTVEPCLECNMCRDIERGGDIDVIEIDGASNNGVDDVRGIRDAVQTQPIRDRRKIYIIDEVQRLSGQAFDALLKTLEEPPEHAMFLFATTDPHKIPDTIVSRCQLFEFRRLREIDIQAKLARVCEAEGMQVDPEVLQAISRGCRGGMRDAESMLDQVLATAGEKVTLDDLESVAGLARPERWLTLFEAMAADQAAVILQEVEGFLERGGTERDFVEQAVDALRDLLHVALLGEDALGVEPAPERRARMIELARQMGRDNLEGVLGMMFHLENRMQKSPLGARALLEWTLLRAARVGQFFDLAQLLGKSQGSDFVAPVAAAPSAAPQTAPPAPVATPAPAPAAAPVAPVPQATPTPVPTPAPMPQSQAPTVPAPAPAASAATTPPVPAALAQPSVAPAAVPQASAPAPAATSAPAPTQAPAATTPAAPSSVVLRDIEALLQRLENERPTLAAVVRRNYVAGVLEGDTVVITLYPLEQRDRNLVEDPIELKALARLAWSPGPWRFTYDTGASVEQDPVVDSLLESFGGQEEMP